ncbi:MAG: hypothetical protein ACRYGK_19435 [Janthinobacterium lividum]
MSLIAAIPRFSSSEIRQLGEKMHGDTSSNLMAMVVDPKSPKLVRDMAAGEVAKRGKANSLPTLVLQDLNKNPRLADDLREKVEQALGRRGAAMVTVEGTEID